VSLAPERWDAREERVLNEIDEERKREQAKQPTVFWPGHRCTNGIPFERIELDVRAFVAALEFYEDQTGSELEPIMFGRALLHYMEAERS
jgi:hypothetical protein